MIYCITVLMGISPGVILISALEYSAYANCECCEKVRQEPAGKKFLREWRQKNIIAAGIWLFSLALYILIK